MLDYLKRLLGLAGTTAPIAAAAGDRRASGDDTGSDRVPVGSWVYQLQDVEPSRIAACDVDLAVVDYSADGTGDEAFSPADVAMMKKSPGGRAKKVIAYMSIGEAESYRFYWNKAWKKKDLRPAWLDRENPDWHENFKVRYWDPAWQSILFGTPQSYLDLIIAAGFDGAYLDIVDAFEYYERSRPSAAGDMVAFVGKLADYARAKKPGFLIIPQNGESLLQRPEYRKTISAIAKEDLYFGLDDDEHHNAAGEVRECLDYLALAKANGIPVMVVEYLESEPKIATARRDLAALGYAGYFGPRDLDAIGTTTRLA